MGVKLCLAWIIATGMAVASAQQGNTMSVFCQRFPNNPNCASSSSSSSNSRPVDPTALGLPPPPGQGGASQSAPSSNSDTCTSWKPVYDQYCTGATVSPDYQTSCSQFQKTCLGGGASGGGVQSVGSQTQPDQSSVGAKWSALTQKANQDQAAQALAAANNGQPNCGQYKDNYVSWCAGPHPINEVYCNTLGRLCLQQAAQTASGQQTAFGPFSNNNGLPTGGAGSTRPLTIGNNMGVGPFFGMGKTLGINPLQGVGTNQGVDVPIAGIGFHRTSGVDWGGLPGVAQLGAALGGRRRRWAVPVGVDHFGNVLYVLH